MKVGFYIGNIQPSEFGGGNTFQISVLKELRQSFHGECIIYYESNVDLLFEHSEKMSFVNLTQAELPKKPFWVRKKRWEKPTFDYIFLKDKIDVLYYLNPYAFITKKIPYILTIWDLAHRNKTYFPEVSTINNEFIARENLFKLAVQRAAYTVIGNSVGKKQLCRYYGIDPERVNVNPFAVPDYIFSQEADNYIINRNNLSKCKYLLYPAQFWAHKNHIRLLKAMVYLKKDGFKMVFTGSDQGNIEYIRSKISELCLENDVLLLGFVTTKELIALYKNAYALTYASFFGPDNIPPLEAMALKCPVVCADFDGAREQLEDAALFFDKLDEHSLIQQVNQLKDKHVRANLLDNGKKLAQKRTICSYVKNINDLLLKFEKIRECWK